MTPQCILRAFVQLQGQRCARKQICELFNEICRGSGSALQTQILLNYLTSFTQAQTHTLTQLSARKESQRSECGVCHLSTFSSC